MGWNEIQEQYKNQWVAISNFMDDPQFPPNSQGEVFASAPTEKKLIKLIKDKHGEEIPLAIEFTGKRLKDFMGGMWKIQELDSPETMDSISLSIIELL